MSRWMMTVFCSLFFIMLSADQTLVRTFRDPSGQLIDEVTVPGIPVEQRIPGPIAIPTRSSVMLSDVPAFDWSYGCAATSAAMMAGYYDRHDYGHVYIGSTNSGVVPLNNSTWGSGECPLSATHTGYDNLLTQGHVNRFWTGYNNHDDDPFGTGDPTANYSECTADYMGTNQDWWNNSDGSTTFFYFANGSAIYNYTNSEDHETRKRDGNHGLRLFFESRDYTVSTNYNQYIYGWNGNTLGYTYDSYKASIDAGIPVLIQLQGHTMLGIGYESTSTTIYVHDTWNYSTHTMTWGGSYSGKAHYGVGILQLAAAPQYAISGTIVDGDSLPMLGVTVSDGNGYSAITNSSGIYSVSVPYWWSGSMIPSFTGYSFFPSNLTYTNVNAAATAQNYMGISDTYVPTDIVINKTTSQIQISWDDYGTGSYQVYSFTDPITPVLTNVTSDGTFQTVSGRVTWTTAIPSIRQQFYRVTMVISK